MSLRHILLGMLREPLSGYDLRKRFDQSLKNFWRAELSQIYPQLQKMESEGLLTSKRMASDIGPQRRVYRRSSKGRKELVSWLKGGPTVGEERIGYLAQVFFLANLEDGEKTLSFMRKLRSYMAQQLEHLESIEAEWRQNDPRYPDDLPDAEFYPQLTLAMGLRKYRANIDWCDEAIARIEKRRQSSLPDRMSGKRTEAPL